MKLNEVDNELKEANIFDYLKGAVAKSQTASAQKEELKKFKEIAQGMAKMWARLSKSYIDTDKFYDETNPPAFAESRGYQSQILEGIMLSEKGVTSKKKAQQAALYKKGKLTTQQQQVDDPAVFSSNRRAATDNTVAPTDSTAAPADTSVSTPVDDNSIDFEYNIPVGTSVDYKWKGMKTTATLGDDGKWRNHAGVMFTDKSDIAAIEKQAQDIIASDGAATSKSVEPEAEPEVQADPKEQRRLQNLKNYRNELAKFIGQATRINDKNKLMKILDKVGIDKADPHDYKKLTALFTLSLQLAATETQELRGYEDNDFSNPDGSNVDYRRLEAALRTLTNGGKFSEKEMDGIVKALGAKKDGEDPSELGKRMKNANLPDALGYGR